MISFSRTTLIIILGNASKAEKNYKISPYISNSNIIIILTISRVSHYLHQNVTSHI